MASACSDSHEWVGGTSADESLSKDEYDSDNDPSKATHRDDTSGINRYMSGFNVPLDIL